MEMSAKFSWVFLLLGFSLVAITLQDVQGGAENDGPTEVDCMPYIEKALKEQAGGEAQKEPSEKNESAEDYPTVEITDDTSAQANDEIDDEAGPYDDNEPQGDAAASVESEEHAHVETRFKEEIKHTEDSKKSEEVAKDKKSTEAAASREVSKEVGQSKEDDDDHSRSEEKAESIEEKEKSKESIERKKSDGKSEETETQQKETKSDEHSIEKEEDESQEDSNEAAKTKESRQTAESVEDLKEEKLKKISKGKDEEHLRHSSKDSKESKEEQESIATTGCPPSDEVNCKDGGARCNKHRHCGEGEICCLNKCYQRKCIPGTPTLEDLADEGSDESEEQQKEAKSAEKAPSGPHTGCPSRNGIPCKEGPVCGKHKQCGEGKICCPNKCYQRKCIAGTPTEEDLAGEESEEESQEEVKSGEKTPLAPSSGCPGADRVPCKDGEPCAKHRHCPGGKICCTNKCYRKQCVAGEATSEELAAEEASAEEDTQEEKKTVEKAPSASKSCPSANHVPCKDGEPCAKHRHCPVGKICCTNKCYRKRCVSGEATSEELAAEEESAEEDEKEEKKTAEKAPSASKSTGCPSFRDLACEKGTSCSKHKHCEEGEMCCVNRCYRRACVPGTPTKDDLAAEGSEESEEQTDEKVASAEKPSAKRTGCPGANKVSCTEGDVCSKHMHCGSGKMCCPNKCYRKRCVSGEPTEEDLAGEEGEESEEEKGESQEAVASEETTGCPAADRVPCKGGPKCTEDEECDKGEICCTNKCYNKKCIPGTPKESVERRKAVSKESKEQEQIESVEEIDEVASIETEEVVSAEVPVQKVVPIVPLKQKPDKPAPPPAVKEKPAPPPARVESKPPTPKVEIREAKNVERVARSLEESSLETGGVDAVEELTLDYEIPSNLRPRNHVEQLLKLESSIPEKETVHYHVYEETLKELKKLYEQAIKPLETLYKYRDLSNRHFGDAEVFSKPLVLFMGPWSGGKSSIINYLVNNEYNVTSLRTGAEPSPAYFNILMYGEEPQIVDGTELAADFTFSGLQKFGQGLEERLRGVKLPSKLLEKVNIVEIPGILEVRKQVSRVFPFNDACQWFIDRADIIFLVYDPAKLDVGPETEAILDQLKGREHQTRIILNKADQVKPEELMRVQGALIWNISPLMSSPHPPVMYTTSLWSKPYEPGAPMRLLQAQERAFLRDLRTAVDNRVEHKISSARRFAVRVRNHAKMVDCYLTTYYNHKSVFGNKNKVANEIIDHPQNYHIYEGLSTLTNISRYDLPDPEAYRDFFRLNPLYEFQPLSATCTYFRGCPINRLDIAIAYDFPELLGTYKRNLEKALQEASAPSQELPAQKKSNKKSKS